MNPESQPRSKWGKVGKVAIIFFVVLLCIAGIAYSSTDIGEAAGSYEKNREAAKQAGAVFDNESAALLYRVPVDDNAAPIILNALKTIEPFLDKVNDKKLPDSDFVKIWLKLEPSFKTLERGCQKGHMIFDHDYTTPTYQETPEFTWTRAWIRTMMRRASIASKGNDINLTTALLTSAAKLNNLQSENPEPISTQFRISGSTTISLGLARIFQVHGQDSQWQKLITEVLKILDKPWDLRPIFRRQHWSSIGIIDVSLDPEKYVGDRSAEELALRWIPCIRKAFLSRMHHYYAFAINSYPTDLYDYTALYKHGKDLDVLSSQGGLSMRFPIIALMEIGTFPFSLQCEAAQRYALMQALEMIRLKQNPAKGLPLKGRFAVDVDGKPFRIKQKKGQWIVYSIGKDKVDDGGTEVSTYKGDFVVHLPKNQ